MFKPILLAGAIASSMCIAGASQAATIIPIAPTVTVAAAGDIACLPSAPVTTTTCKQKATETVAAAIHPQYLFPLGDLVYPQSTYANLVAGYNPSWGKLKSISKPILGNHETNGVGYYQYWAGKGNPRAPHCQANCLGYYSFNVGSWHVLALNTSSCSESSATCGKFTNQASWIKRDLAANPTKCALALIHTPLWSFGKSATPLVKPLYQALYDGGVDLVLSGHDHNYQRFASQDMTNAINPNGLTQMIVGTGGNSQQPVGAAPNQLAAFKDFGVLKLALSATGWSSSFNSISGVVRDPATGVCH